jgi:hypothetical protein
VFFRLVDQLCRNNPGRPRRAFGAAPPSKIARVAVMRKLDTIIWHMLSKRKTYFECRAFNAA